MSRFPNATDPAYFGEEPVLLHLEWELVLERQLGHPHFPMVRQLGLAARASMGVGCWEDRSKQFWTRTERPDAWRAGSLLASNY